MVPESITKGWTGFGWFRDSDGQIVTFFTDAPGIEERWIEWMCHQNENDYNQHVLQLEDDAAMRRNLARLDRVESPNVRHEFDEPTIINLGLDVNKLGTGSKFRHVRRRT